MNQAYIVLFFRFSILTNGDRILDPDTLASYPLGTYDSNVVHILSTRVRGITRSVSARRWEGDKFDARPKPRLCQRDVKNCT